MGQNRHALCGWHTGASEGAILLPSVHLAFQTLSSFILPFVTTIVKGYGLHFFINGNLTKKDSCIVNDVSFVFGRRKVWKNSLKFFIWISLNFLVEAIIMMVFNQYV